MLKQLRRLQRTRSLLIIAFAVILVLGLIFVGFSSGRTATPEVSTRSRETLARVRADRITVGDVATRKEAMQQRFQGQFSLAQFGFTDRRFLDELIDERITAQEAARLGLAASDAEVAEEIRRQFSVGGTFVGMQRYRESVGDLERYEQQVRDMISRDKLQAFVTAGIRASEEDVRREYQRRNTSFALLYVPVVAERLAARIQPTEEELRAHYEQHREEFRINVPQKRIRYLFIDQAKAGERLNIPEEELRAEFERLTPEQRQAGIRVQQIVLRVARPELEATVRTKAEDIVRQARAAESGTATLTSTIGQQRFAELARGHSEHPATAREGGMVPGVVRRNTNTPNDPYQRALELQEGQISEPILHNNTFYILRRGEAVTKTYEQARQELLVSLRNRRAYAIAAQLAERAQERIRATNGDFQAVARELAAEANMSPADMVRETPYVKPGDDVPNIGSSPQFEEAIAPLTNPNQIGERVAIRGGFGIPMLVDTREPRIPDLTEVRDAVAQRAKAEKARGQVEQAARELAAATSPAELRTIAERLGLEPQTEATYKLGSPLGAAGTSPAADDAIFNLQANQITQPIKIGETWVVAAATGRTEANMEEFAQQRAQLMETALTTARSEVFRDYLAGIRSRVQREGQITIDEEALSRMSQSELRIGAPDGGGLPGGITFPPGG